MKRFAIAAILTGLTLLPTACIQQQQQQRQRDSSAKKTEKMKELPPLHLGAVHQVYPEQGFALLRIIGPMPGPGVTLITHPANGSTERIGNLCISSQQPSRDGIIAADIRSGTVVKGDRVFRYRSISKAAEDNSAQPGDVIAAERPTGLAPAETDTVQEVAPPPPAMPAEESPLPSTPETAPASVETTVLPTTAPVAPGSNPEAPSAPSKAPDYLNSIPDSIDDWDSM